MSAPLRIGITSNFFHADPLRAVFKGKTLQYLEERMALSIRAAGAVPLLLPDLKDEPGAHAVLDVVHGLVLAGGADVAPGSYGQEPIDPRWSGDAVRDAYEIRLVHAAKSRGMPILGVCRGAQLLNVALGGTLWQDITTQVDGSLVHRDWEHYDENGHDLRLAPGSWIAGRYDGTERIAVNSIHHQGLRDVARDLSATAWAPDGTVEAVEAIDPAQWIVGVQWHPEWLEPCTDGPARSSAPGQRASGAPIFAGFLQACRERDPSVTVR
jgi:putative glutamine amidotransferase